MNGDGEMIDDLRPSVCVCVCAIQGQQIVIRAAEAQVTL